MKSLKGFTLFEIIISIILVTLLYSFAINSFSKGMVTQNNSMQLSHLKKELLLYEYENELKITCVKKDLSCFLFVDGDVQEEKINGLFKVEPTVYKYNKELDEISFNPLRLEQLETFDVIFEYTCNKYKKCTELIVFQKDTGYIFNDIHMQPDIIEYTSEIERYFEDKVNEVKDAF